MDFSEEIILGIMLAIESGEFEISEQRDNFLHLKSGELEFYISYNKLDHTNFLQIKPDYINSFEVDNNILKDIFDCDIKFNQVPKDVFIKNTIFFLAKCSSKWMDKSIIDQCVAFSRQRDHDYNSKLIVRQNLDKADKAWSENDFKAFIFFIDLTPTHELLSSYQLKYKIAKEKIV